MPKNSHLDKCATVREMRNTPEKHDLIEFARTGNVWMVRCSCDWRQYTITDAFEACKKFANHLPRWGDDQLEEEYMAGWDDGKTVGRDEGYDEGWEAGRKELIEYLTALSLKETADEH